MGAERVELMVRPRANLLAGGVGLSSTADDGHDCEASRFAISLRVFPHQ